MVKSSRFGRSPALSQMMGFVRPPFNMSMAESYTGMQDQAYLNHSMSPTGSPVKLGKPGLSRRHTIIFLTVFCPKTFRDAKLFDGAS